MKFYLKADRYQWILCSGDPPTDPEAIDKIIGYYATSEALVHGVLKHLRLARGSKRKEKLEDALERMEQALRKDYEVAERLAEMCSKAAAVYLENTELLARDRAALMRKARLSKRTA